MDTIARRPTVRSTPAGPTRPNDEGRVGRAIDVGEHVGSGPIAGPVDRPTGLPEVVPANARAWDRFQRVGHNGSFADTIFRTSGVGDGAHAFASA